MADEIKTYNIRFDGIQLIEKNLFRSVLQEKEDFSFQTKVQTVIDPEKKLLVAFASVIVNRAADSNALASIVCAFGYQVQNFETVFEKDGAGKITIPTELDNLLKTVSISTMRGVLFSELRGTPLHNAILPIIPLDTLVPVEGDVIEFPTQQK